MKVFVYDKLMNEYSKFHIPFTFVSYGVLENYVLYRSARRYVAIRREKGKGFTSVYGAIFELADELYFTRVIDGYYGCSKSRLFKNNAYDRLWREVLPVHPITFNSLEDFKSYKFKTYSPLNCHVYVGNYNDKTLLRTINGIHSQRMRSANGLDVKSFKTHYNSLESEE